MKAMFVAIVSGILAGYVVKGIGVGSVHSTFDMLLFFLSLSRQSIGTGWIHILDFLTSSSFETRSTILSLIGSSLLEECVKSIFLL